MAATNDKRGKAAPRRGRLLQGAASKQDWLSLRISKVLRKQMEAAAKASGRSLNKECEIRLEYPERAFKQGLILTFGKQWAGVLLLASYEMHREGDWLDDPKAFMRARNRFERSFPCLRLRARRPSRDGAGTKKGWGWAKPVVAKEPTPARPARECRNPRADRRRRHDPAMGAGGAVMKRLDRDAIRDLKPGETVFGSGIEAGCQQDGDIRYCTATRLDGEKLHRVLGFASDGMTPARAEAALAKMKVDIRGRPPAIADGAHDAALLPGDRHQIHRRARGDRRPERRQEKTHLGLHLIPFFKDQRVMALTKSLIGRYKKHRADQGAAVGTINLELLTLNHMLVVAAEEKWIPAKPCRVQKQAEQRQRRVALTEVECAALLTAALNDSNTYCHLFVACALNTGMRHAEILAMKFSQIDFANRRLDIPVAKAGQRQQPLPAELCAILHREREMADDPDGWVFPSQRPELDGCGHITRMDRPFERAAKVAGIERARVTPHNLRHSVITALI